METLSPLQFLFLCLFEDEASCSANGKEMISSFAMSFAVCVCVRAVCVRTSHSIRFYSTVDTSVYCDASTCRTYIQLSDGVETNRTTTTEEVEEVEVER